MNYSVGSIVEGTIFTVAFGGKGILRTADNFVIFVPFTAPQDVIRCRLVKVKKGYGEAELIEIVKNSPFRAVPKCPYFGHCGGCQLQHLQYSAQVESKEQAIKDAIRKFAHYVKPFPFVMHHAEQHWYYRRHIYLTLKAERQGYRAGYTAVDYTFLPIDVCPIFIEMQNPIIAKLQAVVSSLSISENDGGKVMIAKQSDGNFLLHFHFKNWSENNFQLLEKNRKENHDWKTVIISSSTKTAYLGDETLFTTLDSLKIHYSSSSFMQNHPEESRKIYQTISRIASKVKPSSILDLYCGIGISSLFLSSQAKSLLAIEANDKAIEIAKLNAKENLITNIEFQRGKVEKCLSKVFEMNKWDFVLLNPPRIGVEKEAILELLRHRPKDLVYVSCMPSTLGRDLAHFVKCGYEIQECQAFDMFPQTAHVETLIHLQNCNYIS